jgi:hypothetical protein
MVFASNYSIQPEAIPAMSIANVVKNGICWGLHGGIARVFGDLGVSGLPQPRPVIRNDDRIRRIGWIVFHAGGLARNQSSKVDLPFEARNILRRLIRHSGNRIAVTNQMPG